MNWPEVALADASKVITKGTTPQTLGFGVTEEGVPFVRAQNLIAGTVSIAADPLFISEETHKALKRSIIKPNDLLISIAGTIGRAALVPEDAPEMNCNQAVAIIRTNNEVHKRFLLHWFNNRGAIEQITRSKVSAVISNLSLSQIGALRIPLPPMEEQRRIAAILDKADVIRRKREQTLALADDLLKSAFLEMFAAKEWPTKPLSKVVAEGTIVTYGIVQAGPEYPGGVPYIRTGDIKEGRILAEGLRQTSPEIASKFARSTVRSGEIVMSIRATVGTTAVVPDELDGANLTQGTARISPGSEVTPEYLLYFLRSGACQNWLEKQVKGATFREITLARLRELDVPLPPRRLQRTFSDLSRKARESQRKLTLDCRAANELFSVLSQRAFRGEV